MKISVIQNCLWHWFYCNTLLGDTSTGMWGNMDQDITFDYLHLQKWTIQVFSNKVFISDAATPKHETPSWISSFNQETEGEAHVSINPSS